MDASTTAPTKPPLSPCHVQRQQQPSQDPCTPLVLLSFREPSYLFALAITPWHRPWHGFQPRRGQRRPPLCTPFLPSQRCAPETLYLPTPLPQFQQQPHIAQLPRAFGHAREASYGKPLNSWAPVFNRVRLRSHRCRTYPSSLSYVLCPPLQLSPRPRPPAWARI